MVLALAVGCSTPASPEGALRPIPATGDAAILDGLEARARDVLTAMHHPVEKATWEKAVPRVRAQLRKSLGLDLLPPARPSNVRSVGTISRGDYRIEKLVYETLPLVQVPAHLYLPVQGQAKVPAILFVPGHWYADSKSRPEFQAFAITMAKRGFAVLTYDPFGQGERGISVRDHRRTELLAVGVAQEAIVAFESLCALQLLFERPEVDTGRVGMTGASGGGFNSWIVPALDARIAATVPVVGTADFLEQSRVVRNLDWFAAKEHCHFIPRLFRYANNHELLACIAPSPVMVISAHNDIGFPIPGQRAVVKYGETLYAALGHEGKVGYFEDEEEGHGYQKRKREAAAGWFLKWLKNEGDGSPCAEPALDLAAWNQAELRCFPKNMPAGPGLNALAESLLAKRESRPVTAKALAGVLGLPDPLPLAATPDFVRSEERSAIPWTLPGPVRRVGWRMGDGVAIPALMMGPDAAPGALIVAGDDGKEAMLGHPAVRQALDSGWAVVAADLRGTGELSVTKPGWVYAVSLLLGENFVGRQALDLIAGVRALRAEPGLRGKPVAVLASGPYASLAGLYAAVLEPDIAWLAAERGYHSFRDFVHRPAQSFALAEPGREREVVLDREIPHAMIPFGIAMGPDIPDFLSFLGSQRAVLAAAFDGDRKPVPGPDSCLDFVRARMEEAR